MAVLDTSALLHGQLTDAVGKLFGASAEELERVDEQRYLLIEGL